MPNPKQEFAIPLCTQQFRLSLDAPNNQCECCWSPRHSLLSQKPSPRTDHRDDHMISANHNWSRHCKYGRTSILKGSEDHVRRRRWAIIPLPRIQLWVTNSLGWNEWILEVESATLHESGQRSSTTAANELETGVEPLWLTLSATFSVSSPASLLRSCVH